MGSQPYPEWGVMYTDGSVSHRWNGRTQRQRAEEEIERLRFQYRPDEYRLAQRVDGAWRPFVGPLQPVLSVCRACGMTNGHKMDCGLR